MPRLLQSLVELTTTHALSRKRLVCVDHAYGHELLQTLARATGGWVGWEAVTPAGIAAELAFVPLAERGERKATDVEVAVLVNDALDRVVSARLVTDAFADLVRCGRSAGICWLPTAARSLSSKSFVSVSRTTLRSSPASDTSLGSISEGSTKESQNQSYRGSTGNLLAR